MPNVLLGETPLGLRLTADKDEDDDQAAIEGRRRRANMLAGQGESRQGNGREAEGH